MTIPTITPLPTAPARTDPPATFITRADAFLAAMVTMQTELNTSIGAMNTDIAQANSDAASASASATAAAGSAAAAAATAGATYWVSGQAYDSGDVAVSSIDNQTYRANTSTSGTTDPSASADWTQISYALPDQTSESGKYLTTDGTDASWGEVEALPDQTGNNGLFLTTDGSTASWAAAGAEIVTITRASNTVLTSDNNSNFIDITSGTFTQTFTSAATLGNGWFCYIRNSGTGDITLDPSGSETIDGLTSFKMYPQEVRLIKSNGTNLTSTVLASFYKVFTSSGTFTKPPGYSALAGMLWGAGGGGSITTGSTGGGGGACHSFIVPSSEFSASCSVVIGAGGLSGANFNNGAPGGYSSFDNKAYAYGGDGGSSNYGGYGGGISAENGHPKPSYAPYGASNVGFGGSAQGDSTTFYAVYGGGHGGGYNTYAISGGPSVYGGGGGGRTGRAGGASQFGGDGGTAGAAGTIPGGGGGGGYLGGVNIGHGARGELRLRGVV